MTTKPGQKMHKYTPDEFRRIARGDFLPGIDRRAQMGAYERFRKRQEMGARQNREPILNFSTDYEFSKGKWV